MRHSNMVLICQSAKFLLAAVLNTIIADPVGAGFLQAILVIPVTGIINMLLYYVYGCPCFNYAQGTFLFFRELTPFH